MLIDPATLTVTSNLAVAGWRVAIAVQSKLQNHPEQMRARYETIDNYLQAIESKLDEHLLMTMRAGLRLLDDAAMTQNPDLRREQAALARDRFATLVALDPQGTARGSSGTFSHAYLRSIGYWGNYHYFLLQNDIAMAMNQLCLCIEEHPMEAIRVFDENHFIDIGDKDERHLINHEQWLAKDYASVRTWNEAELLTAIESSKKKYLSYENSDSRNAVTSALVSGSAGMLALGLGICVPHFPAIALMAPRAVGSTWDEMRNTYLANMKSARSEMDSAQHQLKLLHQYQQHYVPRFSERIRDFGRRLKRELTSTSPPEVQLANVHLS